MEIYPLGHASFRIKGKNASVVTDPYNPKMVGLAFPKHTIADVVVISHAHEDHNFVSLVEDPPGSSKVVVSGPGEYEIKGIDIVGIATYHDNKDGQERGSNTIYKIDIDGIVVVHLGDLGHKLSEEQVDLLNSVDVLLIPTGGVYTIDAKTAVDIVAQLEPSIVIPIHYQRDKLNQQIFAGLTPVTAFLKEMGQEQVTPLPKLKVTKDSLPEETQIVVLE